MLQSLVLYSSRTEVPVTRENAARVLTPFFALVIVIVWLGLLLRKKRVQALEPAAQRYGGAVYEKFTGEMVLTGAYKGLAFRFRFCENCKHPSLLLRVDVRSNVTLRLTRETPLTELAQGAGFMSDLQTGDPRFDQDFRLKTGDKEAALKFLGDPGVRDLLAALLGMGYHTVSLFKDGKTIPGMLELEKGRFRADEDFAPQYLETLLEKLKALSEKTGQAR
jgi:hypothetical protein